jgi:hypothetical protein
MRDPLNGRPSIRTTRRGSHLQFKMLKRGPNPFTHNNRKAPASKISSFASAIPAAKVQGSPHPEVRQYRAGGFGLRQSVGSLHASRTRHGGSANQVGCISYLYEPIPSPCSKDRVRGEAKILLGPSETSAGEQPPANCTFS